MTPTRQGLEQYAEGIRRIARCLVFRDEDVEDVVQETFLAAVRKPPPEGWDLQAWLGGVARNLSQRVRRTHARRGQRERRAAQGEILSPTADVVALIEERRRVLAFVRALSEPSRTTVYLRYFAGLTPAEIATRLGEPIGTVKTRLARGLRRLREDLDRTHGGDRKAWCQLLLPIAMGARTAAVPLAASPLFVSCVVAGTALVAALALAAGVRRWQAPAHPDREVAASRADRTGTGDGLDAAGRLEGSARATPAARPASREEAWLRIPVDFAEAGKRVDTIVHLRNDRGQAWKATVGPDDTAAFPELPRGWYMVWGEPSGPWTTMIQPFKVPLRPQELHAVRVVAATTIHGRVVDARTRQAVPDATVMLGTRETRVFVPTWQTTTDAGGDFELRIVPATRWPGESSLRLFALGPSHALGQIDVPFRSADPTAPYQVEIPLQPGNAQRGRVVDGSGAPIPWAVVRAFRQPPATRGSSATRTNTYLDAPPWNHCLAVPGATRPAITEVLSRGDVVPPLMTPAGSDGSFVLEGLERGATYRLQAMHPDFVSSPSPSVLAAPDAPPVVLVCDRYATARIRVVDQDGRAIVGSRAYQVSTESPEAGVVVVRGLAGQKARVQVRAPGCVARWVDLLLVPGASAETEVRMSPDAPVEGEVVDESGAPIPGVYVYPDEDPESGAPSMYVGLDRATSDASGRFVIPGTPPGGVYQLRPVHLDFAPVLPTRRVVAGEPPVRLVMRRRSGIRNCEVELHVPEGDEVPEIVRLIPTGSGMRATSRLPAAIQFVRGLREYVPGTWQWSYEDHTRSEDGVYRLRLWDGAEELLVITGAHIPVRAPLPRTEPSRLTLQLAKGTPLRGLLEDVDGRPIGNGAVVAGDVVCDGEADRTDAAGRFTIACAPSGILELTAVAEGFLPRRERVRNDSGGDSVRVVLLRATVVQGTVTGLDRERPEGYDLVVYDAADEERAVPVDGREMRVGLDDFRFDLPKGRFRLVAAQGGRIGDVVVDTTDGTEQRVEIEMKKTGRSKGD